MDRIRIANNVRSIKVFKDGHDLFATICKERGTKQIHILQSIFFEMQNDPLFRSEIFRRHSQTQVF